MGSELTKSRFRIDHYFLTDANPYTKRRTFRTGRVILFAVLFLILFLSFMVGLSILSEPTPKVTSFNPTPSVSLHAASQNNPSSPSADGSALGVKPGGYGGGRGVIRGSPSTRNHSAAQVIRRGAGGGDPAAALPLGYTVSVRLLNSILSTDTASPVIAEFMEDVYAHGNLSIPAKTRAIGNVRYDDTSNRLQLKFATLVYPEGEQHSIQAVGMMPDGSAGLGGDYHSGQASRQAGRFMGHFIGALADGMKDRQSGGPFGIPYEPGSLKNGILSGIALTAEDGAKSTTEELNSIKPTMTLPAGQTFLLFLEREYAP